MDTTLWSEMAAGSKTTAKTVNLSDDGILIKVQHRYGPHNFNFYT